MPRVPVRAPLLESRGEQELQRELVAARRDSEDKESRIQAVEGSTVPVGTVALRIAGSFSTVEGSWLLLTFIPYYVSRIQYPDLFEAIGETYGADPDGLTFGIPAYPAAPAAGYQYYVYAGTDTKAG